MVAVVLSWRLVGILEKSNYWALRLRLALTYEIILIPYCFIVLCSILQVRWTLPEVIL